MVRKTVSGIMSILLVLSMLSLLSYIQPVRASGTFYIRADGSIDPSTTLTQSNIVGALSAPPPTEWSKTCGYGGGYNEVAYSAIQTIGRVRLEKESLDRNQGSGRLLSSEMIELKVTKKKKEK